MMRLMTHAKTSAKVALGGLLLGGCVQPMTDTPTAPLVEEPMVIDQAMQVRDWDRSTAVYTNLAFVAGSPGFWYQPKWDQPDWTYAVVEAPLFLGQALILPITVWFPPQWQPVNYAGLKMEPTYHAMPPLPPSPAEQKTAAPAPQPVPEPVDVTEPLPAPTPPNAPEPSPGPQP